MLSKFVAALKFLLREVVAIVAWAYVVCSVFIINIDLIIVRQISPSFLPYLKFKALGFLLVISTFLLFRKRWPAVGVLSYIVFYPIVLFGFRIPSIIFKRRSWVLAFAAINSLASFFHSFRSGAISLSIASVSFLLCILSSDSTLVMPAVVALLATVCFWYIQAFSSTFKPNSIYGLYKRALHFVVTTTQPVFVLEESLRGSLVTLSDQQVALRSNKLSSAVLANRSYIFLARKVREYQRSNFGVLSGVISLLVLLLVTAISFAAINEAIYHISKVAFSFHQEPTFFSFFNYSFNNIIFSSIPELSATSVTTQSLVIFERLLSICLITVFASLCISIRSQQNSRELDELIETLSEEGRTTELAIIRDYSVVNIEDAIEVLQNAKGGIVSVILWLSKNSET